MSDNLYNNEYVRVSEEEEEIEQGEFKIEISLLREDLDNIYRYCMENDLGEEGENWNMDVSDEIKVGCATDFIDYATWAHIQN